MDIDQNFEDITVVHQSDEDDVSGGRKSPSSGNFDCNICLDSVQDPVVTLCGHLFCWPCIYKWISTQTEPDEDHHHQLNHPCPVCKSRISHTTLIPIYGRGQGSKGNASSNHANCIPRRPSGPVFNNGVQRSTVNRRLERDHRSHEHMYSPQMMPDPVTRVVCEMVYERLFGNSMTTNMNVYQNYTDSDGLSRRVRRRMMQADKSLSRIYLFLVCSAAMCLLLF